jgi:nicotinate-nucleotide adenylyltransferase
MTNIGILGGTFDPPHKAHIAMARAVLNHLPLEQVLFMPAPWPPHKDADDLTPYDRRKTMVELAISGEAGMELSPAEERHAGKSYTH